MNIWTYFGHKVFFIVLSYQLFAIFFLILDAFWTDILNVRPWISVVSYKLLVRFLVFGDCTCQVGFKLALNYFLFYLWPDLFLIKPESSVVHLFNRVWLFFVLILGWRIHIIFEPLSLIEVIILFWLFCKLSYSLWLLILMHLSSSLFDYVFIHLVLLNYFRF